MRTMKNTILNVVNTCEANAMMKPTKLQADYIIAWGLSQTVVRHENNFRVKTDAMIDVF